MQEKEYRYVKRIIRNSLNRVLGNKEIIVGKEKIVIDTDNEKEVKNAVKVLIITQFFGKEGPIAEKARADLEIVIREFESVYEEVLKEKKATLKLNDNKKTKEKIETCEFNEFLKEYVRNMGESKKTRYTVVEDEIDFPVEEGSSDTSSDNSKEKKLRVPSIRGLRIFFDKLDKEDTRSAIIKLEQEKKKITQYKIVEVKQEDRKIDVIDVRKAKEDDGMEH